MSRDPLAFSQALAPSVSPSADGLGALTLPSGVPPIVSRERFADLLGLPPGVIVGCINKGMLPTVTIGKYSLVNVELLRKSCLEREFTL